METDKPARSTSSAGSSLGTEARPPSTAISRSRRPWLWVALVGVLGLGVYGWIARTSAAKPAMSPPMIPVSAARARQGDLDIYLSQIGTVTPLATVTVRSRVAGQILKIDFEEGQQIQTNQPLFSIDPRPYQAQLLQYEGQLARDKATLANARITYERYQALFQHGVIARQDLDNQRALYYQAQGAIEADQGQIDAVKINLAYCTVVSPITGRIGLRQVDLGNYVQSSDALVVITQLQPISIIFSVAEDQIPTIVKDMNSGPVSVQAWNRDFSEPLADGVLLTFDNQVDQNTGTVKLRAQFPNTDYALFPNQFVNAKLRIRTLRNVILAPTAAVQRTQQGSYTYVVQPNQTVARQAVTVSATQGDVTAIGSGLQPGAIVVTDGLDRLQPGSKVAVRMETNPPMNQQILSQEAESAPG
jgi:membrane fusion protein, multidrug efflux system